MHACMRKETTLIVYEEERWIEHVTIESYIIMGKSLVVMIVVYFYEAFTSLT